MDPQQLWQVAQEELRFQVVRPGYEAWLANAVLVESDGHTFTVGVPTIFARDWVSERYVPLIRETLSGVLGRDCEVVITVDPEASQPPDTPPVLPDPSYIAGERAGGRSQRFAAQSQLHLQHVRRRQLESRSRMRRAAPSPRRRARRTTRCSCTAAWVSARPISCTRSATRCARRIVTRRSPT